MSKHVLTVILLASAAMAAACGNGLSGKYVDEMGVSQYEFTRNGRVYMSVMGIESAGDYEIDGERIVLEGPNGTMVFNRDGEDLIGPMGLRLTRRD